MNENTNKHICLYIKIDTNLYGNDIYIEMIPAYIRNSYQAYNIDYNNGSSHQACIDT
jgi:hypothetical protein